MRRRWSSKVGREVDATGMAGRDGGLGCGSAAGAGRRWKTRAKAKRVSPPRPATPKSALVGGLFPGWVGATPLTWGHPSEKGTRALLREVAGCEENGRYFLRGDPQKK